MKYENTIKGKFHSRLNRFVATVWIEDNEKYLMEVKGCTLEKESGRCVPM